MVGGWASYDIFKFNPWRAPGKAPVFDSCGMAGGRTTEAFNAAACVRARACTHTHDVCMHACMHACVDHKVLQYVRTLTAHYYARQNAK